MDLKSTVSKIRRLEIQGAENIALTAAKTIKYLAKKQSYEQLLKAKGMLAEARTTEPCAYNTLQFMFHRTKDPKQIARNADAAISHLTEAKEVIAKLGVQKIRSGDTIFTHCHSSTVISVLKEAKRQGRHFQVYNTETRPLYQGRITARELVNAGIRTTMFVDSAARLAIKDSDVMLIGCDAITAEGKVINKIGSEMFAEIANRYGVEVFVCTDSWKFDPKSVFEGIKIEQRLRSEVWKEAPGKLGISNLAFEIISPNLVTAIISEKGILAPEVFTAKMMMEQGWIV